MCVALAFLSFSVKSFNTSCNQKSHSEPSLAFVAQESCSQVLCNVPFAGSKAGGPEGRSIRALAPGGEVWVICGPEWTLGNMTPEEAVQHVERMGLGVLGTFPSTKREVFS